MNWLIWKEYRLNRNVLLVGALLLVLPYAIGAIVFWRMRAVAPHDSELRTFLEMLKASALFSIGLSQVTIVLLGGNAIAGERADRSAEFLAYLPVSRGRILAGKILVPLAISALIWIPNLLIVGVAATQHVQLEPHEDIPALLWWIAITGMVFFGVSWLLSSMLESPALCTLAGLLAPVLVVTGIWCVCYCMYCTGYFLGFSDDRQGIMWYRIVSVPLALASFLAGTIYYLRRVEP